MSTVADKLAKKSSARTNAKQVRLRGPIPPGLRSYTRAPWTVANDKLRAEGWRPTVTCWSDATGGRTSGVEARFLSWRTGHGY